ncbi:tetratricopeptide repeat protein [Thioalkalivibrio sp. XN8]|uniref:TPR end-of-group domain-containing protein n=1 Tax=Thioalkalivibrio sp. XN8 TaxID=2712863 RepID=UPI0013EA4523|nr:tetratricopeptide repeat protein [Thioalkalivibrio sp. XN8]NGP54744.1 tetratricopeptide repeat protein [Thioalkalivibrio sp. XN8]
MGDEAERAGAGGLFAELKRRRVIRVVVLYAIGGWIVIEVASTVLPNLNVPDWSVTLVTALVILGFLLAVSLAWAFDLGPEGVRRTPPLAPGKNPEPPVPAAASAPEPVPQPAAKPADSRKSIAVLPFVNMSGDAENEYFSDGIAEEILNLLVKLPQLRVASRTSSFIFKGKSVGIPEVAEKLGVAAVLEGSVRRAGERVRITAQLIDAETDSHLWSETYDRELKDVFQIEDDIAKSIVDALQMTLTPKERRAIQVVSTSDAKAYDYYLRGRSYMYTMTRRDYECAIRMFEQAIVIDDKYALAYAGIGDAYSHLYRYAEATQENVRKAVEASEKAVELDPDSAEARASHGLAMFISDDYAAAEREFSRAIELNPNLWEPYYYFGLAWSSKGEFEKAIEMYKKAMEVNPADYQAPIFIAQSYASLGRKHDEMKARLASLEQIQRHLDMNPHDTRALYVGANQFANVGEFAKAQELAERALGRDQEEPVVLYNVACFYAMKGDTDRAMELLERAVDNGWGDKAWLETDPDLDSLREDTRFQALMAGIH